MNALTRHLLAATLLAGMAVAPLSAPAGVVINEIYYHPPSDIESLQYVELLNDSESTVDVAGWSFVKGIQYRFPDGTRIPAHGFLVVCQDLARFQQYFKTPALGPFRGGLKHSGAKIELVDAQGRHVDGLKFEDKAPWPISPDGFSSSLERISASAPADLPQNWAASPLSADPSLPSGTPGLRNTCASTNLPPIIQRVSVTPTSPKPGEPITVEADIEDRDGIQQAWARYRWFTPGKSTDEIAVPMKRDQGNHYSATLPPAPEGNLVRVRVEALDTAGQRRWFPGENEPRPAISMFVHGPFPDTKIPQVYLIHTRPEDSQGHRHGGLGPAFARRGVSEDQTRGRAERALRAGTDFSRVWAELMLHRNLNSEQIENLRSLFRSQSDAREKSIQTFMAGFAPAKGLESVRSEIKRLRAEFLKSVMTQLSESGRTEFETWWNTEIGATPRDVRSDPILETLRREFPIEMEWQTLATRTNVTPSQAASLKDLAAKALQDRDALRAFAKTALEDDEGPQRLNEKLEPLRKKFREAETSVVGMALIPSLETPSSALKTLVGRHATPVQGSSALVYVSPDHSRIEVFDFVSGNERSAGFKVHLQKDRPLDGMTTLNLIFEHQDRFVIAEPLAFQFYRLAGNASCQTDFVRLQIDDEPLGYYLLCEQPNRAFLRRNKIRDDGQLYKLLWFGHGLKGQHEKKTHVGEGHADLEATIAAINNAKDEAEQWTILRKEFDLEQVITYFAVNLCLSHWDGFFNNYFAYHDTRGTGKWTMYPWDQDKTWGYHDGLNDSEIFYNMPITFGMEGDRPPGLLNSLLNVGGFGMGNAWWRPGGWFSKPLLSNPTLRALYFARVKDLLEHVYTREKWEPLFQQTENRLREEVRYRATLRGGSPDEAEQRLKSNLQLLREHLEKRRKFLLNQPEIHDAGPWDRSKLK